MALVVLRINNRIWPYFFIGLLAICALIIFALSAENNPEAMFSQVSYSLIVTIHLSAALRLPAGHPIHFD